MEAISALAVGDFEKVATGVYLEGLSVDHQRNIIWYSDVIAGGIHGVKADGSKVAVLNEGRMWTGGVMMNEDGSVLSSGQGGIMWNNPESGKSGWLLHEIDGEVINGINEMWPDGSGGIYFGTLDIERVISAEPTRPTAIYRLTADNRVIKLAADINFTNGIAYDDKRNAFYCSDTFACAWAWDVEPDLSLSNRRLLLDNDDCDGMALDVDGNIWITGVHSAGIITRIRPDGAPLAPVKTPGGATTQVRFAGADMCDFYINIVPADAGDNLKEGKPLSGASYLYRGRSDITGVPVMPSRFKLG